MTETIRKDAAAKLQFPYVPDDTFAAILDGADQTESMLPDYLYETLCELDAESRPAVMGVAKKKRIRLLWPDQTDNDVRTAGDEHGGETTGSSVRHVSARLTNVNAVDLSISSRRTPGAAAAPEKENEKASGTKKAKVAKVENQEVGSGGGDAANKKAPKALPSKPGRTAKGTKPGPGKRGKQQKTAPGLSLELTKHQIYEFDLEMRSSTADDHEVQCFLYTPNDPRVRVQLRAVDVVSTPEAINEAHHEATPTSSAPAATTPPSTTGTAVFRRFRLAPRWCGSYLLEIVSSGSHSENKGSNSSSSCTLLFQAKSPIQDFRDALEHYMDLYSWAWSGNWSEEFEAASLELLSVTDAFFEQTTTNLRPFMQMLESTSIGRTASLDRSREHLEDHMAKAIHEHDGTAVGMAFESVREMITSTGILLALGGTTGLRDDLLRASLAFDAVRVGSILPETSRKLEAARASLIRSLNQCCVLGADRTPNAIVEQADHGDHDAQSSSCPTYTNITESELAEIRKLPTNSKISQRLKQLTHTFRVDTPISDFMAFHKLEPTVGLGGGGAARPTHPAPQPKITTVTGTKEEVDLEEGVAPFEPTDLERLPVVPEYYLDYSAPSCPATSDEDKKSQDPQEQPSFLLRRQRFLTNQLLALNESLYNGAFMPGQNFMTHYALAANPFARSHRLFTNLFRSGCCYVCQGAPDEVVVGTAENSSCWRDLSLISTANNELPVPEDPNVQRVKRMKDVIRVLKLAKRQGMEFQLAVNSSVRETVDALRGSRESNWVEKNLTDFWCDHLLPRGEFFVLQLFLLELPLAASSKPEGEQSSGADEKNTKSSAAGASNKQANNKNKAGDPPAPPAWQEVLQQLIEEAKNIETVIKPPANNGTTTTSSSSKQADTMNDKKQEDNNISKNIRGAKRTLIAADFCHLAVPRSAKNIPGHVLSGSVYVATRYSNPTYKKWQPGFLLAFLAQNFLKTQKFRYWDLGSCNGSPMMSYKTVVADRVTWAEKNFRVLREQMNPAVRYCDHASASSAPPTTPSISECNNFYAEADSMQFAGDAPFSNLIEPEHVSSARPLFVGKEALQECFQAYHTSLLAGGSGTKEKPSATDCALQSMKFIKGLSGMGFFDRGGEPNK